MKNLTLHTQPTTNGSSFGRVWLITWLAIAALLVSKSLWWSGAEPTQVARASTAIDAPLTSVSLEPRMPQSPKLKHTFTAIDDLRVGDRVISDNPDTPKSSTSAPEQTAVDPATWKQVTLYAEETWADGTLDTIHIETLQPPLWFELFEAKVGAKVPPPLDLVEMGLPEDLQTTVKAIEPCPALQSGKGRVVLTTVNHLNNDVWELTAINSAGRQEKLSPTGFHKFYSETRRDWVSTKDIHDNEVIRGRAGPLTIVAAHPLPGTQRVYNLTVEGEHVYYVSELGLLAHNNCPQEQLIDNNLLTRIVQNDPQALRFAQRRAGRLSVTDSVVGEALVTHSLDDVGQTLNRLGIKRVANPNQADVLAEMAALGATSNRQFVDVSLIVAARNNGLGLVTADRTLFNRAFRSGVSDLQFRIFNHSQSERNALYNRVRTFLSGQGVSDPNTYTGGR